ncbi:hypothetical protein DERP_001404 [Dermatophagoides pteronyssinus]|uniref:Uncharacterized protein n=1 Tax=Dermatophagoides pteronyssinus TaxID=6956 RepID=A0ABQ8JEC5_DERPT|nr:hypothetical protein DERP_001404 [Dermatophagoides pteronyssinus]
MSTPAIGTEFDSKLVADNFSNVSTPPKQLSLVTKALVITDNRTEKGGETSSSYSSSSSRQTKKFVNMWPDFIIVYNV